MEELHDQPSGLEVKPSKRRKFIFVIAASVIMVTGGFIAAGILWYNVQLRPVGADKAKKVEVTIVQASSPKQIAKTLKQASVIKNETAFLIYTRLSRTGGDLQAGTYRLSPAETTPEIVKHLTSGTVDTFSITFLPGATLAQNRQVLLKAGYTADEVDTALSAHYDSPLFTTKPANTDLEGYIYGETYSFGTEATVKDVLTYTFDEYEKVVEQNDLVAKFKSHGLTLYQGITLASIVQREASGGDEAGIAQVFYNRLHDGMTLGSDVTYQYIADKMGVARDVNIDSPYNTRRYPGLPPGPIAVPGKAALDGVANPSGNDYLFFLSGDDNITYYAHTAAEHEANIEAHCKVKCSAV